MLPAEWVRGTRIDGSPNLSHGWARTVDGAQGGTWEAAHLLGTPALDAFRGYVGQSRARQPTHTWNTTPVMDLDHGGRIADARTPDEHVLVALARTPDPRLAAVTDPNPTDRRLRAQVAEHLDVLNSGPPDRTRDLGRARETLEKAERKQAEPAGTWPLWSANEMTSAPLASSGPTVAENGAGSTGTPKRPSTG